jgi:transcriptional regulator with GAF, ATPase, and Fis domain
VTDDTTASLTRSDDAGLDAQERVLRVVVLQSADKDVEGRSFVLGSKPILLGRPGHVEGPLALHDGAISRIHAELVVSGGDSVTVRDHGSRNGTHLNGKSIGEGHARSGDVIRVGGTLILVQAVLAGDLRLPPHGIEELVGDSLAMRRLGREIREAAPGADAVLILGESGTGKELVARALHRLSGRKEFVDVNCGALPAQLMESELFGHAAGAFTGAQRAKQGLFEVADGGTLFLDEVGELPFELQPKLLRALSAGEVRPVGATVSRRVDVRVVAATNRNLLRSVDGESFRGDLYARLARWVLHVPRLADRADDVLPLARHFLAAAGGRVTIDVRAAEALVLHRWRFNVREVENVVAVGGTRALDEGNLSLAILAPLLEVDPPSTERELEISGERAHLPRGKRPPRAELERLLREGDGNVAKVSAHYGRNRRQVYRWLEHYGMKVEDFRAPE